MKQRLTMLLSCLFLTIGMATAQITVKGTIISSDDGQPLPGASVKIAGTKSGTVTDINGKFTITVPDANTRLELSHIGMLPRLVKARDGMQIALDTDTHALDEVMVIAYGTTKRSTFTGSAVEIKSEDITNHVSASATSALVGKVAGMQATGVGQGPGSTPSFKIRGIGSLGASSAPLYIVDGAPMEVSAATINPQDIESISVLKDASASAIYGARGANGVIIITTKKAKGIQDAEVTFDAKWGSNSRLVPNYDVITDPAQHYETFYKALYNSRKYHGYSDAESHDYANSNLINVLGYQVYTVPAGQNLIGTNFKINPNATLGYDDGAFYYTPDNWYNETFHNSFRQEYNVSVNGGNGKLNYYGSVGYLNDGGYVNNSRYQRYTSRINVDYQAKKWLKLSTSLGFTHSDSESPEYDADIWGSSGNLFYIANSISPIYPLYVRNTGTHDIRVDNGITIYDSNQTGQMRAGITGNAVRDNEYNRSKGYSDIFTGKWQAVVTPIEGLDLSATMSATSYNNRSTNLYSRFANAFSVDGAVSVGHSRIFAINQIYQGSYSKTFGNHTISALVGYERYRFRTSSLSGYNDHLYDPFVAELNNSNGLDMKTNGSATDNLARQGYFGRLSYDFGERYFIDGTIRREASSIFAPGHRWGTFGSVGLGWQINKEAFLKNVDWIDLLKLKASYGSNGNDNLGYYAYADRYSASYNNTTGEYTLTMSAKGNNELTWEKKKSWNFGLDVSLFKYRLNATIEAYFGNTTDMLYSRTIPLSSGVNAEDYPVNVGKLFNSGVEVTLDGDVIRTKNIKWNLNLMLAHNHNKIKELDPTIPEDGLKYSNQILVVGGSAREAYMIQFAGLNDKGQSLFNVRERERVIGEDGKPTDEYKTDENGKPIYTGNITTTTDLAEANTYGKFDCGDMLPKLIGGFGTTFDCYGFDLSAQFSFQLGGKFYDGGYQAIMRNGVDGQASVLHKDLLKAWTPDNTDTDVPRLSYLGADDPAGQYAIDRFLTSSNYLTLNNLTLGYTLPKSVTNKIAMKSLRVYVAGENLFLLSARKGMDPRYTDAVGSMTTGGGRASGNFATMRSIIAGLTVKF